MDLSSNYEKIDRWIPSKYDVNGIKDVFWQLCLLCSTIDYSSLFKLFDNRIKKLDYGFMDSAITSGATCFFGSLIMSICQLGYIKNIDELFTFAACYILTDHYIDDNTVPMKEKIKTINQIDTFINNITPNASDLSNENNIGIESEIIKVVAKNYISMINKIPSSEKHLKEMFQVEVKTMFFQTNPNLNRQDYLYISEWKGGLFCIAIQSLLELEITQAEYEIGAVIQLVDEVHDIDDDIQLGINTIATYDYKTYGNLDKLLDYIINKIDNLNSKYNLFKPLLYSALILAVKNHEAKYTQPTINLINNFNYYQPTTSKQTLMEWLIQELNK